jgi:hypothetical protein
MNNSTQRPSPSSPQEQAEPRLEAGEGLDVTACSASSFGVNLQEGELPNEPTTHEVQVAILEELKYLRRELAHMRSYIQNRNLAKDLALLASMIAFLCFVVAHLECPDMS